MAGLSAPQIEQIQETLAAGKRPRVMFTEAAGQIAGQIGQVIQLDDPAVHDEWILVKFGGDALPFAPSDLTLPPKGAPKPAAVRKAEPVEAPVETAPEPEFILDKPIARQERSVQPESPVEPAPQATPAPRKPAGKTAKVKAPPGLTVTIAYTEGEWTVGAIQGTKALAKPYVIKPAEALQMVSLLDVPGVQEAVEQILSSERAEAQAHAERLRAELAELEVKLAELG
ncbi:hypothetical protein F4553_000374 [Allocatelliglobosispora scoriae]|uniref:Uncharacterized protein n=1 Tax=Allocatelliglobosispora scoriae TaxID=643052 RepID=A0A841BH85_9ACTN|nr:hypothetical protein [Allocatelliglobosispora scoriae]MBB5866995.1 hypothetical protein [Allocatelliglobosispora scoriae]